MRIRCPSNETGAQLREKSLQIFRVSKYLNRHCFRSKYACTGQQNFYCARADNKMDFPYGFSNGFPCKKHQKQITE